MGDAEDGALAFCQLAEDASLGSTLYLKTGSKTEDRYSANGPSLLKRLKRQITGSPKNEKAGASTRVQDNLGALNTHRSEPVRNAAEQLINAVARSKGGKGPRVWFDADVKSAARSLRTALLVDRLSRHSPAVENYFLGPSPFAKSAAKEPDTTASVSENHNDSPPAAPETSTAGAVVLIEQAAVQPVVGLQPQPVPATATPQPKRIGFVERDPEGNADSYLDDNALADAAGYIYEAPLGSVLSLYEDSEHQLVLLAEPVVPGQAAPQPHPDTTDNVRVTLKRLVDPFTTHHDGMVRQHAKLVLRKLEESELSGQPLTVSYQFRESLELVYGQGSKQA